MNDKEIAHLIERLRMESYELADTAADAIVELQSRLLSSRAAEAQGWAVVDSVGFPQIKTVSDTRRAAIVNWLVTEGDVMVLNSFGDAQIERLWIDRKASFEVVPVTVRAALNQEAKDHE